MEWSPQDAMKAYLQTLQLCKLHDDDDDQDLSLGSKRVVIEPKCMEFISALAAGKRAKSMVEITTQGITPITIALAVAAKQTGAQFLCFLVSNHNEGLNIDESKHKLIDLGLEDVIHFFYKDPFEGLMHEGCKDRFCSH
ncbi:uncharacterized protein LOC120006805 [Tripterygium wilfordii]|uniref:uncharacterized protein LOC120006805 n=1 Tax=Tripterygium wilfordii TaxID=458696 RepID=UPI0018F80FAD|nr:uncharacterized protein LOC120006805 [Tripterygium wilfordii]